jgi:long-chain fatty acid transport protein
MRKSYMKTLNKDWKLGAAVGTALSLGSAGAIAGPHGFDLHNVLNGASASFAGTSIAHVEDPVSAVFGNPATLTTYYGGTNFMFGATFYMPRATMVHDGSAGHAVANFGNIETTGSTAQTTGIRAFELTNNGGISPLGNGGATFNFNSTSKADIYAVPQVAVTQDLSGLGIPVVLGVGVTATNGIGVDYKHTSNSIGAAAELINLGVNAGIGMKMSDTLDVGVAMTITYAMLEAGITGSGGMTHDIGFRGTLGARKKMSDSMTVGLYYQTELEHQYDNLHVTSMHGRTPFISTAGINGGGSQVNIKCNGDTVGNMFGVCRQDLEVQQPWNVGLGVSMDMGNGLLVMADVTHKAWSDAKFFNEFYDDQNVVSIGVQKTMGNLKLRAGYGYADDPLLSTVAVGQEVASIGLVNTEGVAVSSPMYGIFMSYFQAMETPVIYKHRIAVGLGVENFLGVPFLSLDTHAAIQLEEDKCFGSGQNGQSTATGYYNNATIGTALAGGLAASGCEAADHSKATVSSMHLGGALTWSF